MEMKTLKELREAKGISQAKIAALVDTHPAHYSRVERGIKQPGAYLLWRIAKVLDTTVDHLLQDYSDKQFEKELKILKGRMSDEG